jgi:acyl-CoA reductase-like NAD-dependent aldehyde dehydrogenase
MLFASQEASEDTLRTARLTTAGPSSTELISHPGVAKITFTGSDATAAKMYETTARNLKPVSLELGGKSPNIVFEDAEWPPPRRASYFCGHRADLYRRVAASRAELDQGQIRRAPPGARKVRQDRRSDAAGYQHWSHHHAGPIQEGARLHRGGKSGGRPLSAWRKARVRNCIKGGQFVESTIFTDVDHSMRIAREEVFEPVLSIISFDTEEDAIRIANDRSYGLAAGTPVTTRKINDLEDAYCVPDANSRDDPNSPSISASIVHRWPSALILPTDRRPIHSFMLPPQIAI